MKNEKVKKPIKVRESNNLPPEKKEGYKKTIENHKKAAAHHMEAAKYHLEAAKHYEAGNHEKAAHSIILAVGHNAIAGEFLNDDAKHHAQTLKQTNYHF
ncbi:MAG: hypothetical protein ABI416_02065 [Ginsengibacter sp.]